MTGPAAADVAAASLRRRQARARLLAGAAVAVTVAGIVLASLQPEWLTTPLRSLVAASGAAAPVVFVLLCVVAAPAHLSGVLVALSAGSSWGARGGPPGPARTRRGDGVRTRP